MCETDIEALCRREGNKLNMKFVRLCETDSEALYRREANRLNMKFVRLSESEDMAKMRKEMNKIQKQRHVWHLTNVIALFLSKVKCGPDYVCIVCRRLLYKSSVILLNESKYGESVLRNVKK